MGKRLLSGLGAHQSYGLLGGGSHHLGVHRPAPLASLRSGARIVHAASLHLLTGLRPRGSDIPSRMITPEHGPVLVREWILKRSVLLAGRYLLGCKPDDFMSLGSRVALKAAEESGGVHELHSHGRGAGSQSPCRHAVQQFRGQYPLLRALFLLHPHW